MKKAKMFADGGARGNPGPAGSGAVIYDENDNIIAEVFEYIGEATNNQAEYYGVIIGLKKAKEIGVRELDVFLDSELIVKQVNGEYRVKNEILAKKYLEVYNLKQSFVSISFSHIPREKNQKADSLVNKAIDKALNL